MNRQTYFMDQLCTIGIGAAYAGVMTAMYVETAIAKPGEHTLLSTITGWIQVMVLLGAGVLLVLVVLRAIGVWRASGDPRGHEHDHGHEHHAHDHDHAHAHADHDHPHLHDHGHGHDHAHDHGWSPWQYAVMIFPLMLFFLPLDYNQLIPRYLQDLARKSGEPGGVTLSGGAGSNLAPLGYLAMSQSPIDRAVASLASQYGFVEAGGLQLAVDRLEEESSVDAENLVRVEVDKLEELGRTEEERNYWRTQVGRVSVSGDIEPNPADPRMFRLVRFRMACCIGDARPSMVIGVSRKKPEAQAGQWVTVQGKLDFGQFPDGRWRAVIRAFKVTASQKPLNYYLR
jgi:hypothetical protein